MCSIFNNIFLGEQSPLVNLIGPIRIVAWLSTFVRVSHRPLRDGGALLPPMGGNWCRRWGEHPAKRGGERSILVHARTWELVIFALLQGVFLSVCVCVCVCVRLSRIFRSWLSFFQFFVCFSSKLMYGSFSQAYFIGAGGGSALVVGERTKFDYMGGALPHAPPSMRNPVHWCGIMINSDFIKLHT